MTSKTEPRLLCYDLGEGVTAFSTTRHGGVSEDNYASFNINPYCGDGADHVARNRQLLADRLGLPASHIVLPHQVHGIEHRAVAPEHIHHAGICTFDHADDYFSARRLGIDSGRIYTGILMQ